MNIYLQKEKQKKIYDVIKNSAIECQIPSALNCNIKKRARFIKK